ncbi:P-loop containing nucleoside triphosphate hydrolase protein [Fomitopsis serialis]|uniref:P-loop containing nucleoside triphosphate hydrolase protein n=1 Tax=Fomitopsis serialis TaxID=139415 RepID=UPI002007A1AD|nr:P-loop containing nucleoside triphosphate hydrolase protein [Neoantrodia serialis]KAH9931593.1 P-loop containing nucleoside triphosphate hydrolase protein [Neoantrodia serialis]
MTEYTGNEVEEKGESQWTWLGSLYSYFAPTPAPAEAEPCVDISSPGLTSAYSLQVKRVDHVYDMYTCMWSYEDTKVQATPHVLHGGKTADGADVWRSFCFVVVRQMPTCAGEEPAVAVTIKSPYLVAACQDVIGEISGISWTADPLELPVDLLIQAFPKLVEYRQELEDRASRPSDDSQEPEDSADRSSDDDTEVLASLEILISYLREDHGVIISQIAGLLAHEEITWDLLHAILLPGTLLVSTDATTGEPRALQLKQFDKGARGYTLYCEGIDAVDVELDDVADSDLAHVVPAKRFCRVEHTRFIPRFKGVVKINTLPAYPMKYHSNEGGLRAALLARARKWIDLYGVQHVRYQGISVYNRKKFEIDSRVMIDGAAFRHHNPNYDMLEVVDQTEFRVIPAEETIADSDIGPPDTLTRDPDAASDAGETTIPQYFSWQLPDDDLILASPVLYGFSLSDKLWLEFNVEKIHPIVWSDEPFTNLVLPGNRRELLRSLIEAHNSNINFDDFVQGKGQGLVINLFGPPGVGKTLSAEATSEHLKRPLYMIGGGDLGTDANAVDTALKRVFSIATRWGAIVLIDEADVFLEQRSMHDLLRNAMVAVFLRHVEYYRGILFLTTNRVTAFDPAFLSRIHVALHFRDLSKEAKLKIWQAFLHKVKMDSLTAEQLDDLVGREVNGRQIKNATRTATSLARSRGETLGYSHLAETLDAMEEFESEFNAISRSGL